MKKFILSTDDNETNGTINLVMNYIQEYNFGFQLLSAIISNTVSMVFIIIAASITFYLKKYFFKLCYCLNDEKLNDQIDNTLKIMTHGNIDFKENDIDTNQTENIEVIPDEINQA
jgi:hypothetical protein